MINSNGERKQCGKKHVNGANNFQFSFPRDFWFVFSFPTIFILPPSSASIFYVVKNHQLPEKEQTIFLIKSSEQIFFVCIVVVFPSVVPWRSQTVNKIIHTTNDGVKLHEHMKRGKIVILSPRAVPEHHYIYKIVKTCRTRL